MRRLLTILLIAAWAPGCTLVNEDLSLLTFDAPPRPDTEPPRVIRTEPAEGETDALRSQPIRVFYDEPIDPASFDLADFTVTVRGEPFAIQWTWDAERFLFEAAPDQPFDPYVDIVAVLPAGLADTLGHVTAEPFVLSYTTGPRTDETPPVFSGVDSATDNGDGSVTLTWEPAEDDFSAADRITYVVYMGNPVLNFSEPVTESAPGAGSVRVRYLLPGPGYVFAVRARDASGNEDGNEVELETAVTAPTYSYAAEVQPVFDMTCAGAACHEGPDTPSGLDLSGDAWDRIVDQPSPSNPANTLVTPGDWRRSVLALVLTERAPSGYQNMPLVGSLDEEEVNALVNWIVQGAQDN